MNWSQRLDLLPANIILGVTASADILEWNYRPHLSDNAPHRHTYCEVCLVGEQGAGEFRVADQTHLIGPGDLFFARPGLIHQIVNTQAPEMELFWVGFSLNSSSVGEIALLHRAFRGNEVVVTQDAAIWHLWQALRCVSERGGPGWENEGQSIAAALLLSLLRAGAGPKAPASPREPLERGHDHHTLAQAAIRYIEDNLNRRLPLAEIANHLHVSPRQLTRIFTAYCGVPPAAYIERARLDEAENLLLKTNKPLKEIARQVGFDDTSHFSGVFARGKGAPPGQFRRAGKGVTKILASPTDVDSGRNLQKYGRFI